MSSGWFDCSGHECDGVQALLRLQGVYIAPSVPLTRTSGVPWPRLQQGLVQSNTCEKTLHTLLNLCGCS